MRMLLLIICTLFIFPQIVAGQTKEEIIKYHIYKKDKLFMHGKNPCSKTTWYDSLGRIIKETEDYPYQKYSGVTYTEYRDSLITQEKTLHFRDNQLEDSEIVIYDYQLIGKPLLLVKTKHSSSGRIYIDQFTYDQQQRIDSVYVYDNDTLMLGDKPTQLETKYKGTVTLKRIKEYSYLADNRINIKDCEYPNLKKEKCTTEEMIEN